AVFLNFSRDTLVNDEAMAAALAAGKVGTYVTDFANPAVMKMERAIVLPHLGASTAEAEDNCAVMAVRQTMDYLENGNIVNSVNYPACDMGPCPAEGGRVAVLHANVPNMISQITNVFGDAGVNIDNLTNKARGEAAYTLLDLNAAAPDAAVEKLAAIEGVRRVRVVK
ncbi:MAG: phosphoglycerate dehydrogenase, partial [Paraeggerthella sp.]|nr:phosphoglycerate dehydrogenase [Paraeggerthella sp.]